MHNGHGTPDLEGDIWSLWDSLDGMGWAANAEQDPILQLLPWSPPLGISAVPSELDLANAVLTPGHTPSPASKLQASLQNNASADQTPATPPVQPRAPSDHGQAQPTAAVGSRVNASGPPSWAEEGSMGGAQRAAANWAAPGAAPEPARPVPATPAPVLPRLQPPPAEASKPPRKDSTQRKKVHCKQKIVATSQIDQSVLS